MKAMYWIVAAAITLAGVGIMSAGAANMHKQNAEHAASASAEETFTERFTDIQNLDVKLGSALVTLQPDPDAVDITVNIVNTAAEKIEVSSKDGTLILEEKNSKEGFQFSMMDQGARAMITVPEGMNFEDVRIQIGSGDLENLCGIKAEELKVVVGSGDAVLRDVEILEKCRLESGSGSISMENCTVEDETALNNGSGCIDVCDCTFGTDLDSVCGSGNLYITDVKVGKDMNARFGSGDLNGESLTVGGKTEWELGSGNIDVNTFAPGALTELKLGSGDVNLTLCGSYESYRFDTGSFNGDLTVGGSNMKHVESGNTEEAGIKQIKIKGGSGSVTADFE